MNKKGFTLIELLAVIVILAVIAIIAVPTVLNIIEDVRKSSAESSAKNIAKTAETYYMTNLAKGQSSSLIDLTDGTLKYDGDKVKKGYLLYDEKGNAFGKMYINGYCVTHNVNNTVVSEKINENECDTTIVYPNGYALYFNPKDNIKCDMATSSRTGTNDTCMKWYAFLDNEESDTVKLLLDHNTTAMVPWNVDSNGVTPVTVEAKLQEDIANWDNNVKTNARLITASEVNQIVPNDGWKINDLDGWYFLHTGSKTPYEGEFGSNKYAWLIDNTWYCGKYGCNFENQDAYGYWTSDYASAGVAWRIHYGGALYYDGITSELIGVRPVIEVPKSIFE